MKNRNVLFYIIAVFTFFVWVVFSPYEKSITVSLGQYVLATAFIIFLAKTLIFRNIFSKKLLFFLSFLLIIFFFREYVFTSFVGNKVALARLSDDPLEIDTSSFRTWINKRLKDNSLKLQRIPFEIDSRSGAKNWLNDNPKKEILIWGNKNYIKLSFPKKENIKITSLIPSYKNYDFLIFTDIQNLKIPYEPKKATVTFISNLVYKINKDEFKLRQTQYQKFLWKNNSHKAYPLFLVGNYKLIKYLKTGEWGFLKCAINHYEDSLKFIKKQDAPILYAKINNNLVVSFYLRYINTGNIKYKKKALKVFKKISVMKHKIPPKIKGQLIENYLKIMGNRKTKKDRLFF